MIVKISKKYENLIIYDDDHITISDDFWSRAWCGNKISCMASIIFMKLAKRGSSLLSNLKKLTDDNLFDEAIKELLENDIIEEVKRGVK